MFCKFNETLKYASMSCKNTRVNDDDMHVFNIVFNNCRQVFIRSSLNG